MGTALVEASNEWAFMTYDTAKGMAVRKLKANFIAEARVRVLLCCRQLYYIVPWNKARFW